MQQNELLDQPCRCSASAAQRVRYRFQSRTSASLDPEATVPPEGLQSTQNTSSAWPGRSSTSFLDATSHTCPGPDSSGRLQHVSSMLPGTGAKGCMQGLRDGPHTARHAAGCSCRRLRHRLMRSSPNEAVAPAAAAHLEGAVLARGRQQARVARPGQLVHGAHMAPAQHHSAAALSGCMSAARRWAGPKMHPAAPSL